MPEGMLPLPPTGVMFSTPARLMYQRPSSSMDILAVLPVAWARVARNSSRVTLSLTVTEIVLV